MDNSVYTRDLDALAAANTELASQSPEVNSSRFITCTYVNLMCAVALFACLETLFFKLVGVDRIDAYMSTLDENYWALNMLGFFGVYIVGVIIASIVQSCSQERGVKYFSLVLHVIAESVFLVPFLAITLKYCGATILFQGIALTVALFAALSAAVFVTRANFTIPRVVTSFLAIAFIQLLLFQLMFGFQFGAWFSAFVIGILCMYVLYETSKLIHREEDDKEDDIDAAIALFGTLTTLLLYVLDLLGSTSND